MYSFTHIFRNKLGPNIYLFDIMYNNFDSNVSMLIGYSIYDVKND